jgi:hypothetical protein
MGSLVLTNILLVVVAIELVLVIKAVDWLGRLMEGGG